MTTKAKTTDDNLRMMEPETIMFNERNPRSTITDLDELKSSLEANGIIQPIAVRAFGTGYKVVAGSRRLAAAIELGWPLIPTRIVVADDRKALELAVTENVIRKDMSTLDEIIAVGVLTESGEAADDIAVRFGRTPRWVATYAKIAKMPQVVLDKIDAGELSLADAQELCRMSNRDDIERIANTGMSGLKQIVNDYIRELSDAPWVDKKSPCEKCLQRSDKQINLFEDGGPARCMDSVCWTQKRDAWIAKKTAELRKNGYLPKQEHVCEYAFCNYSMSILNPEMEEEKAQIDEMEAAGIKPRFMIDADTFEVILRYDADDIPEKTVLTPSGDEASEEENDDDLPEAMNALGEDDLAEDEEPESSEPSEWEIKRAEARKAKERAAEIVEHAKASLINHYMKDWNNVVPFFAEYIRKTNEGPLDELLTIVNEQRVTLGQEEKETLIGESTGSIAYNTLCALLDDCDSDYVPDLIRAIGMDYDAIESEVNEIEHENAEVEA